MPSLGLLATTARPIQLLESDLAPMIDGTAMAASSPVGSFSAIPTGAFLGAGTVIKGETAYVVWTSSDFLAEDGVVGGAACGTVTVSAWQGSRNVTVEPQGTLAHLAPVLVGGPRTSADAVSQRHVFCEK